MNRRALAIALLCSALTAGGLIACGHEAPPPAEDTTPIVGLFEIPISRNNQGHAPSDATRVEISPTELRLNGSKVLDLTAGRPPANEVSDHVITKLQQQIRGGAARSRASLRVHASVPYLTMVETLKTLESANLHELNIAVRTLGASPTEGWMVLHHWRTVPESDEPVEFSSRPLPWSAFTDHWQAVYDACRAGQYIDCDGPYPTTAEGGTLGMELWTRGQGMKVTFRQEGAPEEPEGADTGPALIEGVAAPAPVAEEESPPATEGAFNVRHQEAAAEESALSSLVAPVCANQACQVTVVADGTGQSMRVISMIGAVFPNGTTEGEIAFVIPRR
jgi:hypothetical protein